MSVHDLELSDRSSRQPTIHIVFENVYKKLSTLFESLNGVMQYSTGKGDKGSLNDTGKLSIKTLSQMKEPVEEDQLYGVLNEYKIENKKLKESKRLLEGKISDKDVRIISLEDDLHRVQGQLKECQEVNDNLSVLNEKYSQKLNFKEKDDEKRVLEMKEIGKKLEEKQKIMLKQC